ncbi:hypothetical protein ACFVRU_38060 [Streptomyces sp. NPDC057927]
MQEDVCVFCDLTAGYVNEIRACHDVEDLYELMHEMIHEVKTLAQLELVQDNMMDLADLQEVLLEDLNV